MVAYAPGADPVHAFGRSRRQLNQQLNTTVSQSIHESIHRSIPVRRFCADAWESSNSQHCCCCCRRRRRRCCCCCLIAAQRPNRRWQSSWSTRRRPESNFVGCLFVGQILLLLFSHARCVAHSLTIRLRRRKQTPTTCDDERAASATRSATHRRGDSNDAHARERGKILVLSKTKTNQLSIGVGEKRRWKIDLKVIGQSPRNQIASRRLTHKQTHKHTR